MIGIFLLLLGVYNTSKDLELIHDVNNLHQFASTSIEANQRVDELAQALSNRTDTQYQLVIIDPSGVVQEPVNNIKKLEKFPLDFKQLESFRINPQGGYVEVEEQVYTWVKLALPEREHSVVLIHKMLDSLPVNPFNTYLKRLLIPAIFYLWLMVWVGLILRFLTDQLQSQNEALTQMALHDSLTGLPNRVLLEQRLNNMIQQCQANKSHFALAVIDLNKFKAVNDSLGHDQGDELLCLVAGRIGSIIKSDTIARIGGDEFVLLLNGVTQESSLDKCKEIKNAILKPYSLREGNVVIGLSIGIALFPEHGIKSDTLMRHADLAMYQVKSSGGGINIYSGDNKGQSNLEAGIAQHS